MKIYKGLLIEISKLLKKYSINDILELRISKFKNYDYQINLLVRHKSHKEIEKILEEISAVLTSSELIEEFDIADNLFINLRVNAQNINAQLINVENN